MKAIVHQSVKDNQWYAEFKAANNETWYVSEGYTTEQSAVGSVTGFYAALGGTAKLSVCVIRQDGSIKEDFSIGGSN